MIKQARPTRLKDGSWGARVQGSVKEKEIVTIRTKGGKEWDAQVTRIVWSGKDKRDGSPVCIVATKSVEPPPRKEEPELPQYEKEDFPDDDKPFCEDEDDIPF